MTDEELKLREETLGILFKKYGDGQPIRFIYECADEWCKKFKTTSGLIKYYETYYNDSKKIN